MSVQQIHDLAVEGGAVCACTPKEAAITTPVAEAPKELTPEQHQEGIRESLRALGYTDTQAEEGMQRLREVLNPPAADTEIEESTDQPWAVEETHA